MINFFNQYWWFAIPLELVLWLGDSYLTVVGAKLYEANEHYVFQHGYELNPTWEKSISQHKWFTRRHLITASLIIVSLAYARLFFGIWVFEFFAGFLILTSVEVDLRHLHNIYFYKNMKKPNSVSGKVEISYWLSQRSSSANFIAQSILFGLVAIATLRPFFWGGAAAFLVHGVRHFYLANRFSPPSENLAVPKSTDGNQGIDNAPSSSEKHKQKSTEEIHRTNILIIVTLCTLAIVLTIFYVSVLTALVKPWLPLLGIK